MKTASRHGLVAAALVAISCQAGARTGSPPRAVDGEAHAADTHAPGDSRLGAVSFSTSCRPEVEQAFDNAVALLHHMMYAEARDAFAAILHRDRSCAMAHWGVAMSLMPSPYNDAPEATDATRGHRAVAAARALGPRTARERDYIEAAAAYHDAWQTLDHGQRAARYAGAMRRLHLAHPEDVDAAAFYALALLATAPPEDRTYSSHKRAAQLLEVARVRAPTHPGALHYGIHAHDVDLLADRGAHLAEAYLEIAPQAPHALHVASHLHVRLGYWEQTIASNRRAMAEAERGRGASVASAELAHAADYLIYALLQQLRDEEAAAVLAAIGERARYQQHFVTAHGVAAAHARVALERRRWRDAARLGTPEGERAGIEWARYPAARAVIVWARGVGAARSGELDAARRAQQELEELAEAISEAALSDPAQRYWARRARVQSDTIAAWVAAARGEAEEAWELMRAAADLEDRLGKDPVTPGHVLPARELLGDLLLETDEPAAALRAYERALVLYPDRANSLYGAAKAAQRAGDRQRARQYYTRLLAVAMSADSERPILIEARSFVASRLPE